MVLPVGVSVNGSKLMVEQEVAGWFPGKKACQWSMLILPPLTLKKMPASVSPWLRLPITDSFLRHLCVIIKNMASVILIKQ